MCEEKKLLLKKKNKKMNNEKTMLLKANFRNYKDVKEPIYWYSMCFSKAIIDSKTNKLIIDKISIKNNGWIDRFSDSTHERITIDTFYKDYWNDQEKSFKNYNPNAIITLIKKNDIDTKQKQQVVVLKNMELSEDKLIFSLAEEDNFKIKYFEGELIGSITISSLTIPNESIKPYFWFGGSFNMGTIRKDHGIILLRIKRESLDNDGYLFKFSDSPYRIQSKMKIETFYSNVNKICNLFEQKPPIAVITMIDKNSKQKMQIIKLNYIKLSDNYMTFKIMDDYVKIKKNYKYLRGSIIFYHHSLF